MQGMENTPADQGPSLHARPQGPLGLQSLAACGTPVTGVHELTANATPGVWGLPAAALACLLRGSARVQQPRLPCRQEQPPPRATPRAPRAGRTERAAGADPACLFLLSASWPARAACLHVTRRGWPRGGRLSPGATSPTIPVLGTCVHAACEGGSLLLVCSPPSSFLEQSSRVGQVRLHMRTHDKIQLGSLPWLSATQGHPFPHERNKARCRRGLSRCLLAGQ